MYENIRVPSWAFDAFEYYVLVYIIKNRGANAQFSIIFSKVFKNLLTFFLIFFNAV